MHVVNFAFLQSSSFLLTGPAAFFVTVILGIAIPVAMMLYQVLSLREASSRKMRFAEAEKKRANFVSGRVALAGFVEVLDDNTHPVTLTIRQHGTQGRHKNRATFRWEEDTRTLDARPFILRLDSGEKVLVEPGDHVRFIDRLAVAAVQLRNQRICRAELTAEERAVIYGELVVGDNAQSGAGPFRESGHSQPVLRAPRGGFLEISSTSTVAGIDQSIFKHRFGLYVWALYLVLANALVFRSYYTAGGLEGDSTTVGFFFIAAAYIVAIVALRHRAPWYARRKISSSGYGTLAENSQKLE